MVYVTVTVINKDFTLIEKPDAQRPANGMSLCRIFNDLEREGYTLVGAGGAEQLVFVFHKPGLVEEATEEKKEEKKEKKEKKGEEGEKKKDKKDKTKNKL